MRHADLHLVLIVLVAACGQARGASAPPTPPLTWAAAAEGRIDSEDEAHLQSFAAEAGFTPRIWRDPTSSVARCEMTAPG